jgi:hypothetical protein
MMDPQETAEQIAQHLRNEVFWQQFWMHTADMAFTLGMAAIGAFSAYIGYLRLKAGQKENADAIKDGVKKVDDVKAKVDAVETKVDGHSERQDKRAEVADSRNERQNEIIGELKETISKAVAVKVIADARLTQPPNPESGVK